MAEIYVNSNTPIKTKIYWEGELVTPDGSVTAAVTDITEDPTISPPISPSTVLTTITATAVETDIGTYQVVLPFSYSVRNRKFRLLWSYTVSGIAGIIIFLLFWPQLFLSFMIIKYPFFSRLFCIENI